MQLVMKGKLSGESNLSNYYMFSIIILTTTGGIQLCLQTLILFCKCGKQDSKYSDWSILQ